MMQRKNEKGITLIALVITIIILLILAGVTIVTLTGENGILIRASEAKKETEKATIIEKAKIDILAIQTENNGEISENELKEIITKYDKDGEIKTNEQGEKYIITQEGHEIKVKDIYSGSTKEPSLAEKVNSNNYGDYIDYNVNLGIDGDQDGDMTDVDDWRIFYKDKNNNLFIIAADYVPSGNDKLVEAINKNGMRTKSGYPYSVHWESETDLIKPGSSAINTNVANKFMFSWLNSNPNSQNNNAKAVAALLDTNAWSSFATGISGAEAIGGPTIEMFVASWNEKGYTTLYCNNSDSTGYYLGTTPEQNNTDLDLSSFTGNTDKLYCPHNETNDWNGSYAYWMASPCAYGNMSVLGLAKNSLGGGSCETFCSFGVRPVVCLPTGTNAIQDEGGIWRIQ